MIIIPVKWPLLFVSIDNSIFSDKKLLSKLFLRSFSSLIAFVLLFLDISFNGTFWLRLKQQPWKRRRNYYSWNSWTIVMTNTHFTKAVRIDVVHSCTLWHIPKRDRLKKKRRDSHWRICVSEHACAKRHL